MTDETLSDVVPAPEAGPTPFLVHVSGPNRAPLVDVPTQERERVRYKELYEEMCDEKEEVAANLSLVHRELQMARRHLEYQSKVVRLQEEIIALLKHHTSYHDPASPPIDEEHPF